MNHMNQLNAICYCFTEYVNNTDIKILCDRMLEKLVDLTRSKLGYINEIRENNEGVPYLHYHSLWSVEGVEKSHELYKLMVSYGMMNINERTIFGSAIINNKLMISNEPINNQLFPEQHPTIKNFTAIPLFFHDKCIGQIGLANRRGGYSESYLSKFQPIIMTITNILGGCCLSKELEQQKISNEVNIVKQVSEAKDMFLANMSHEIRTPLNGIIGTTELLMDTDMSEEQREYIHMVNQCGLQLLCIINDILDYSKIIAGKMEICSEPVEIRRCLEECYDIISARASKKKLNISYIIEPNVPEFIKADSKRINQILINLLNNAVKFTNYGSVVTRIKAEDLDYGDGMTKLYFTVSDTGIGINPEKQKVIFSEFNQVDNKLTRSYDGTGLGLAICKNLVKLFDGELSVESQLGVGSHFTFTVIAQKHQDKPPLIETDDQFDLNQCNLVGKNVLIVDDNITNRIVYFNTFIKWKMKPQMCSSAEEAIAYLNNYPFDVVFVDICMPNVNGIELAKRIKDIYPELPLIAISSIGDVFHSAAGVFYHKLTKPVKQSKLFQVCQNVLRSSPRQTSENIQKKSHQMNNKEYSILIAEDTPNNQFVIKKFLGKLGFTNLKLVENGQQVLDALEEQSYNVLLLDIKMPIMDGYTTVKEINKLISPEDRPYIIALTANALNEDKGKCLALGMQDYLSKPFELENLKEKLNKVFSDM